MEASVYFFKQSGFLQGFGDQSMFDRLMVENHGVSVFEQYFSTY